MINKIDDGSGVLDFEDFLTVSNCSFHLDSKYKDSKYFHFIFMIFKFSGLIHNHCTLQVIGEKDDEYDIEIHYKDTFKAFSKDKDGKLKLSSIRSNIRIRFVTPTYNNLARAKVF